MTFRIRTGLAIAAGAALTLSLTGFVASEILGRRIERRFPPAGQFVEADGVRLHYTDTMPQGAPVGVVLLIHGASGNERDMRLPLAAPLAARGYRVISVDRPGHGYSTRGPGDASSPAVQALVIRHALEALGVRRAIVVGHSLAGALATNLAIDHQDFTAGLALFAPVTHPWPGGVAAYYSLAASASAGWLFSHTLATPLGALLIEDGVKSVFAPQEPPSDYLERTGVALVLRPQAFRYNAQDVDALYGFVSAQAPRLSLITAPVAIVSGDQDDIVLTNLHSRGVADAVEGTNLIILVGHGHSPHWTATPIAVSAILDVAKRAGLPPRPEM